MGEIWFKYNVDFANRFWLDPVYEIGLNSMGKIRLFKLSSLFESLQLVCHNYSFLIILYNNYPYTYFTIWIQLQSN